MKLPAAALLSGLLLGQSTLQYVRTKTNDGHALPPLAGERRNTRQGHLRAEQQR